VGFQRAALGGLGAVFQCADGGGAYGYDATAFGAGAVEGFGGGGGEGVAFAVEVDFVDPFDSERGEGAEAYVEGEFGDFDPSGGYFTEYSGGEVKASGMWPIWSRIPKKSSTGAKWRRRSPNSPVARTSARRRGSLFSGLMPHFACG